MWLSWLDGYGVASWYDSMTLMLFTEDLARSRQPVPSLVVLGPLLCPWQHGKALELCWELQQHQSSSFASETSKGEQGRHISRSCCNFLAFLWLPSSNDSGYFRNRLEKSWHSYWWLKSGTYPWQPWYFSQIFHSQIFSRQRAPWPRSPSSPENPVESAQLRGGCNLHRRGLRFFGCLGFGTGCGWRGAQCGVAGARRACFVHDWRWWKN